LSPETDLSLTAYFTRPQVVELVRSYRNGHDADDPFASPLQASGLPPIRVHVGDNEVLSHHFRGRRQSTLGPRGILT
jgi:acetyl esterase/lipase